jgi:hypothetical protein
MKETGRLTARRVAVSHASMTKLVPGFAAVASPRIQLFLCDPRRRFASFPQAQAAAGGKQ